MKFHRAHLFIVAFAAYLLSAVGASAQFNLSLNLNFDQEEIAVGGTGSYELNGGFQFFSSGSSSFVDEGWRLGSGTYNGSVALAPDVGPLAFFLSLTSLGSAVNGEVTLSAVDSNISDEIFAIDRLEFRFSGPFEPIDENSRLTGSVFFDLPDLDRFNDFEEDSDFGFTVAFTAIGTFEVEPTLDGSLYPDFSLLNDTFTQAFGPGDTMVVDAAVVPEPAHFAFIFGLSGLIFAHFRRRRR